MAVSSHAPVPSVERARARSLRAPPGLDWRPGVFPRASISPFTRGASGGPSLVTSKKKPSREHRWEFGGASRYRNQGLVGAVRTAALLGSSACGRAVERSPSLGIRCFRSKRHVCVGRDLLLLDAPHRARSKTVLLRSGNTSAVVHVQLATLIAGTLLGQVQGATR